MAKSKIKHHRGMVCFFCGHLSGGIDVAEEYDKISRKLVNSLSHENFGIITGGGGGNGIMHSVTHQAIINNSYTIQILPQFLLEIEGFIKEKNNNMILVNDMEQRKKEMFSRGDVFVLLFGAIGSLDEFFEIITAIQLKRISKNKAPVIIFNHNGYWQPLKNIFDNMIKQKFLPKKDKNLVVFCDSIEQVVAQAKNIVEKK